MGEGERGAVALPRFMTIKSWFAGLWEEGQLHGAIDDTRELISPLLASALWRHIAAEVSGASPAESATLADRFAEAWMLEHGYREGGETCAFAVGANGEIYRSARAAFVQQLRAHHAISAEEIPSALCGYAEALAPLISQHLVITPQFSSVQSEKNAISILTKNRSRVLFHRANIDGDSIPYAPGLRTGCADPNAERDAVIDWVTARLGATSAAREASRFAIVVPDLQRSRARWQRALSAAGLTFNLSLGMPVSTYPWAAAGFTLVSSLFERLPPETIAQALRHPRWGYGGAVRAAIGRRERELLQRGDGEVNLFEFCEAASAALLPLQARIEPLRSMLRGERKLRGHGGDTDSRAHWRDVFERAIAAFGDLSASLDTQTYQLRTALLESIEQWAQLDRWLPHVSIGAAQRELISITDRAAFQPEGSDAPLQVIGLLESAGVPFDAMWITGCSERLLPERARANPFLSAHWQRARRAGLASVDECDARAARLVSGWQQLSGETIASLPARIDDEPQSWSPLVSAWEHRPALDRTSAVPTTDALSALETIDDEIAPGWRPDVGKSRGVSALEAQAHCPRRGFARGRLRLTAWPSRTEGLSPQARGELVHRVAEKLALQLKARPMDFEHLVAVLPMQVEAAIAQTQQTQIRLPAHVWRAEQARLERVFAKLIEAESTRPEFFVQSTEQSAKASLGALGLSLRIDRVDELARADRETGEIASRGLAVIDFKSGQVDKNGIFDERLTAPQLPLYALALGFEKVDAVAYAMVTDDRQSFVSFGTSASGLEAARSGSAKPPPWAELIEAWKAKLAILSSELIGGDAVLAPAYGAKTCGQCDFQRFCRIDLSRLATAADADEPEAGTS